MSKQSDLISVSQGAAGDPLFIDTANNRVGVGTSSPAARLGIPSPLYSSSFTGGMIRFQNPDVAADSCIQSYHVTGAGSEVFIGANSYVDLSGSTVRFSDSYASSSINVRRDGDINFNTNTSAGNPTMRVSIDSAGRVTMPYQPRFSGVGFAGAGSVYSDKTNFTWTTVHVNDGNHFNNTTGLFTCPVAGKYAVQLFFNRRATHSNWSGAAVQKNNVVQIHGWFPPSSSDTNFTYAPLGLSLILSCDANDTISLAYYNTYSLPISEAIINSGAIALIG